MSLTVGDLIQRILDGATSAQLTAELGHAVLLSAPLEESSGWSFRTESKRMTNVIIDGQLKVVIQDSFKVSTLRKDESKPFANTVLIGRAASNDVVFDDSSVSKLHARLTRKDDGWWISDAGSSNGTFVGSIQDTEEVGVEPQRIESDTLLMVGQCSMFLFEVERLHKLLTDQHLGR